MNRGMTLIEVVVAISLLSAIMLASLDWTRTTGVLSARVSGNLEWEAAARATLQLIEEDLVVGDFQAAPQAPGAFSRVVVHDGSLSIQTRERGPGGGAVSHQYAVEDSTGVLELRGRPLVRRVGARPYERALLGDIRRFEIDANEEEAWFTVKIESTSGRMFRRRYALP